MTEKFKKGDRVKVVNEEIAHNRCAFALKNGDTGVVVSAEEEGDFKVEIDGHEALPYPWWIPQDALELAKPETKGE